MSKRILIADDEMDVIELLKDALIQRGFEIITASTGVNTLLKAIEERPDLILLDIRMPAGSGIGVFENIIKRKELADIPVIFITAFATPEIKKKVIQNGAAGFITKPFDADVLIHMIEKELDIASLI